MNQSKVSTETFTAENFSQFRISFFLKISYITLLNTMSFFIVGYGLDRILNSKPLYTIIFLVISFPVLQLILYKYVRRYNKN